jgi:hypothetical protein
VDTGGGVICPTARTHSLLDLDRSDRLASNDLGVRTAGER